MVRIAAAFLALSSALGAVIASPVSVAALQKRTSGRGTYYLTGLGACGWYNVDSDKVIALSAAIYDGGAHCGQKIRVTNTATGATGVGTVADECPGCGPGSLDMTEGLFEELGTLDQGVLPISWEYISEP